MTYKNTIDNHVFREHALDSEEWYYASTFMEKRLEITGDGYLNLTQVPCAEIKNVGIKKIENIAPYEMDLLNRIYECKRRFFILQGGTGCGKSSCIRYIKDKSDDIISKKWRIENSLNSFIERVDLQNCFASIAQDESDLDKQLEKFLNVVASDFLQHLRDLIYKNNESVFFTLGLKVSQTKTNIKRLQWMMQSWFDEYGVSAKELVEAGDADDFHKFGYHIYNNLNSLWGEEKLQSVTQLAVLMSLWLQEEKSDLIICIDNADKIPTSILSELVKRLTFLDETDYFENSRLKIFMHLRMSTTKDAERTHPNIAVKSSSSLSPYLAIVMRIIIYFFSDERKNIYSQNTPDAQKLDSVLLEVLVRLVEPHSPLSEILESLSGSNMRRGFEVMKKWLADPKNVHSRFPLTQQNLSANKSIVVLLCSMWLRKIISDYFEELLRIANGLTEIRSNKIRIDRISKQEEHELRELNQRIVNELAGMFFIDHRNSSSIPKNVEIGSKEISELLGYLNNIAVDNPSIGIRLPEETYLARNINDLFNFSINRYWNSKDKQNKIELDNLKELVTQVWKNAKYIKSDNFTEHETHLALLKSWTKTLSTNFKVGKVAPRFLVSCELLSCFNSKKGKFKPYNVLTSNSGKIDLAGVWCLCLLHSEYIGRKKLVGSKPFLTGQLILTKMKAVGFTEKETKRALSGLTQPKYRLIFASTFDKDHFKNGTWLDKEFYFSWCGYYYVTKLLGNEHYIQWCMFECDEIRKKNFHTLSKKDLIYYHEESNDGSERLNTKNVKIDTAASVIAAMNTIAELVKDYEVIKLKITDTPEISVNDYPNLKYCTPMLTVGYQLASEFKSLIEYAEDEVSDGIDVFNKYIDDLVEHIQTIQVMTHRNFSQMIDSLSNIKFQNE